MIREATWGPGHLNVAAALNSLAWAVRAQGRYAEAEALFRRDLQNSRAALGDRHADVAISYGDLGQTLLDEKRAADALVALQAALDIRLALFGERHEDTADSYQVVAVALGELGRHVEAETLERKVVEIRSVLKGETAPETVQGRYNLAITLRQLKRYDEAEALIRAVLDVRRPAQGEAAAETAKAYAQLGNVLDAQGRYVEGEAAMRSGLEINLALFGERHMDTAASLNDLAFEMSQQRRFEDAVPIRRRILAIHLALLDEKDPTVADSLTNLAQALDAADQRREGEVYHRRALAAVLGRKDDSVTYAYMELAFSALNQGRTTGVEALLRAAVEANEIAGATGSGSSRPFEELGVLLSHQGRHEEAAAMMARTVAIRRESGGPTEFTTLAQSLQAAGRGDEAEAMMRRILQASLGKPGFEGPGYPNLNLGSLLIERERYAEAETYLRQAVPFLEQAHGEHYVNTAAGYSYLADSLDGQNRYPEAEMLRRKALEIRRIGFSEQHWVTRDTYVHLALNLAGQGRMAEAEATAAKAVDVTRQLRRRELALGGSAQDVNAGSVRDPFDTYLEIADGLRRSDPAAAERLQEQAFTAAQDIDVSSAGEALAQAAARIAAGQLGLGDTVARRQVLAVTARELNQRLLRALAADDKDRTGVLRAELAEAEAQLTALETEVRTRFPRYSELVSPEALDIPATQARLAPGEGLLLFAPAGADVHVFAVSRSGFVWRTVKGGADTTARAVARLRCQMDANTCAVADRPPTAADAARYDRATAYGLYRDLIRPVESALMGVDTLYVTASGPISSLPLGLLITQAPRGGGNSNDVRTLARSHWLADKYALITLPSVSSLRALGGLKSTPGNLAFLGYGDPVLGAPAVTAIAKPPGDRGFANHFFRSADADGAVLADPNTLRRGLESLPGTQIELRAMAEAMQAPAGMVRLGSEATETAVKTSLDLGQARVIAFATHGLLPRDIRGLTEPGLVFTPPDVASEMDDGVLTASEAARLTLNADWVILSACNTASADGDLTRSGGRESLSALAKAFLYAGAKSLLASHWRVLDDATAALTVQTLLGQTAHPGGSRAQALQAAMRVVRTGVRADGARLPGYDPAWAHPSAWAPFTLISAGD